MSKWLDALFVVTILAVVIFAINAIMTRDKRLTPTELSPPSSKDVMIDLNNKEGKNDNESSH